MMLRALMVVWMAMVLLMVGIKLKKRKVLMVIS